MITNWVDLKVEIENSPFSISNFNSCFIITNLILKIINIKEKLLPTAVCRNYENFAKLINFFRKKFYLSRKKSVTKSATLQAAKRYGQLD
jgi:hypothetical protein